MPSPDPTFTTGPVRSIGNGGSHVRPIPALPSEMMVMSDSFQSHVLGACERTAHENCLTLVATTLR